MEPRNFVSVVPAAKKGKLGPIFLKYPFHVQTIGEKAKNRTKNEQKPSKIGVFSSPSDQLAIFVANLRTFECKIFRPQNVVV